MQLILKNHQETIDFGKRLAKSCNRPVVIYLSGQLGAGKTTFTQGFLQQLGVVSHVKSPTFTLVEPYECDNFNLYHLDLYRLESAEELEYIGINDYFAEGNYVIIEWPEKGSGILPKPDIKLDFSMHDEGRVVNVTSCSDTAEGVFSLFTRP